MIFLGSAQWFGLSVLVGKATEPLGIEGLVGRFVLCEGDIHGLTDLGVRL